jgi:hypothetical protein
VVVVAAEVATAVAEAAVEVDTVATRANVDLAG